MARPWQYPLTAYTSTGPLPPWALDDGYVLARKADRAGAFGQLSWLAGEWLLYNTAGLLESTMGDDAFLDSFVPRLLTQPLSAGTTVRQLFDLLTMLVLLFESRGHRTRDMADLGAYTAAIEARDTLRELLLGEYPADCKPGWAHLDWVLDSLLVDLAQLRDRRSLAEIVAEAQGVI